MAGEPAYCGPAPAADPDGPVVVVTPGDVRFMVNRGYSSSTAMNEGRMPVVIYLGNHDPSGTDLTRDMDERLVAAR